MANQFQLTVAGPNGQVGDIVQTYAGRGQLLGSVRVAVHPHSTMELTALVYLQKLRTATARAQVSIARVVHVQRKENKLYKLTK